MDQASLKKLYAWFDQMIELEPEEEQRALQDLRQRQEPLILHLECLLASARKHTTTTAAFGINDLVHAAEIANNSESLTVSLSQLSKELNLDQEYGCYRVGDFLLKRCLSVSKLGITYHAQDTVLDRDVVVLLAMPKWRSSSILRNRLVESARVVAKLFHPNVASILGTMEVDGQFVILRQWIPGASLQDVLIQRGAFDLETSVRLGRCISSGLEAIHQSDVLHGDLKPANIILREGEATPVITDFGTSLWLGAPNEPAWKGGTPGYIAPEILSGAKSSKAADLYSLGVILYQIRFPDCLSSHSVPPSGQRWANRTKNEDISHAQFRYERLVDSLLAEQSADRPHSIHDVLIELNAIGSDLGGIAKSNSGTDDGLSSIYASGKNIKEASISRRSWIKRTFEYGMLGTVSTSLGFIGTRVFGDKRIVKSPYVPGINANRHVYFPWDRNPDTARLLSDLRFPPSELCDTDFVGVTPTVSRRWIHLETECIQLPDFQVKANLIMLGTRFDLPPRQASIQLAYRYIGDSRWNRILDAKNTFGGPYFRHFQLSVDNASFRPSESLQFRLSVWADVIATHRSNNVPVAINVHQDRTDRAMVQLRLWDRLIKSPDDKGSSDG
jgi:serine/threonine protein kinase